MKLLSKSSTYSRTAQSRAQHSKWKEMRMKVQQSAGQIRVKSRKFVSSAPLASGRSSLGDGGQNFSMGSRAYGQASKDIPPGFQEIFQANGWELGPSADLSAISKRPLNSAERTTRIEAKASVNQSCEISRDRNIARQDVQGTHPLSKGFGARTPYDRWRQVKAMILAGRFAIDDVKYKESLTPLEKHYSSLHAKRANLNIKRSEIGCVGATDEFHKEIEKMKCHRYYLEPPRNILKLRHVRNLPSAGEVVQKERARQLESEWIQMILRVVRDLMPKEIWISESDKIRKQIVNKLHTFEYLFHFYRKLPSAGVSLDFRTSLVNDNLELFMLPHQLDRFLMDCLFPRDRCSLADIHRCILPEYHRDLKISAQIMHFQRAFVRILQERRSHMSASPGGEVCFHDGEAYSNDSDVHRATIIFQKRWRGKVTRRLIQNAEKCLSDIDVRDDAALKVAVPEDDFGCHGRRFGPIDITQFVESLIRAAHRRYMADKRIQGLLHVQFAESLNKLIDPLVEKLAKKNGLGKFAEVWRSESVQNILAWNSHRYRLWKIFSFCSMLTYKEEGKGEQEIRRSDFQTSGCNAILHVFFSLVSADVSQKAVAMALCQSGNLMHILPQEHQVNVGVEFTFSQFNEFIGRLAWKMNTKLLLSRSFPNIFDEWLNSTCYVLLERSLPFKLSERGRGS